MPEQRTVDCSRRVFLHRALLAAGLPLISVGCAAKSSTTARGGILASAPAEETAALADTLATTPPLYAAPDFSHHRILRFVAGVRPFRSGRVRIEVEAMKSKLLIHNYGHGGAGVTLSWGSAEEVVRLVNTHAATLSQPIGASFNTANTVAVMGAGVIGLTAAHDLLQAGYSVRIYAKAKLEQTTSWLAGAQWAPSIVARGNLPGDSNFFSRLVRTSHARFIDLADEGDWGVQRRPNFVASVGGSGGGGGGLQHIPPDLMPPVDWLNPLPLAGVTVPGRAYQTMLIEPPIFLPRLTAKIKMLGGEFVQRTFESVEDAIDLPESVIINCLGLGARDVIQDSRVIPMRGQLVHLQPQDLPYLLSHGDGYIFPRRDAVVLGGTVERGIDDTTPHEPTCWRILEHNARFFRSASTT